MFQYQCLNPISKVGLDGFTNDYTKTEEIEKADAILVRSASMHEMKLPENIQAIAVPEPVSTTFRYRIVQSRVSSYSIHREPTQTVSKKW